jgi:hypothetical protein
VHEDDALGDRLNRAKTDELLSNECFVEGQFELRPIESR